MAVAWAVAAHAEPPPLEAYGRLPGFGQVWLSPTGARYAFIALVDGKRRLLVVEGGKLLSSLETGDTRVRRLDWAGEDHVLITTSKSYAQDRSYFVRGRIEISQTLVVNIAARSISPVFTHSEQDNGVWGYFGARERGGRWYGYFGALTIATTPQGSKYLQDGHPDLFEVDLDSHAQRRLSPGAIDGHARDWVVGPDGEVLATEDYAEAAGDWRLFLGKDTRKPVVQIKDPLNDAEILGQGRTPGSVVYETPDSEGLSHWFEVDATDAAPKPVFEDQEPSGAMFDPQTGQLLGAFREGHAAPIVLDPDRDRRLRASLKAFDPIWATLVDWNSDFKRLILFTSGKGDSGTYWLVDIDKRSADPIGRPYPGVADAEVGPVSVVDYKAADGLALHGVLTLPPGREAKGLPLVVMPHGGPGAHDNPVFDWWAQAFASRGYAVFQPNFRGSTGGGAALYLAGKGQWGRKMQTDVSDGVAELVRQGIVDPRRVCVVGASYGGYVALAGVTLQHGLYRCAVSYGGVSDLDDMSAYDIADHDNASNAATRYWAGYIGSPATLHDISPRMHAGQADAPVLLIHGKNDTVVPLDQSQAMAGALRRAGKPVELLVLDGEDHWLSAESTRLQLLQASVAFVEKNNPPR